MAKIGEPTETFLPTGLMVYYYRVCRRKLWYFTHGINMENNSSLVALGKILDESTYTEKNHQVLIDNRICLDFIDDDTIHETKKSNHIEEASILQLKYYIFYMKRFKDKTFKGILHYPQERRAKTVELTDDDEKTMPQIIDDIKSIIDSDKPAEFSRMKICAKCAYFDLCAL